jgi:hypothetical protein
VRFQVLVDRSSIELFADQGQATISTTVFPNPKDMGLSLAAEGGAICAVSLAVNRLESIWLEDGTKSVSAGLPERAGTGAARGP